MTRRTYPDLELKARIEYRRACIEERRRDIEAFNKLPDLVAGPAPSAPSKDLS